MARLINSKWEGLQPGSSATDGVNYSQLDARLQDAQKRQSYWHGFVVTGNLVTVANGNYTLDSTDATPPYFFPVTITVRQTTSGTLSLGVATISIGTNAPNYNNLITLTNVNLASMTNGVMLNIPLTGTAITPLVGGSAIVARVNGLVVGTSIKLAIDINGAYRSSL